MAEDLIRYDILVQDALRGIVRKVLSEVARTGLPGDHHFYVSFETFAPGVQVSNRVRSKYPKEMTIVLQHQFWDLTVTENAFDIGLSFGGVPEHLHIPFKAVKGFFDPEVQFNLQFEPYRSDDEGEAGENAEGDEKPNAALMSVVAENAEVASGTEGTVAALGDAPAANEPDEDGETEEAAEEPQDEVTADEPQDEVTADETPDENAADADANGADVVSLDAFRKKT